MAQTYVFQDQITGSFISEINDNVNLTVGSSTLLDDLNGLRTQIRKVLHPAGSWTDIPELDLYEINSRFTGSITLNYVTSSFLLVTDDLNVEGNSSIIGDLAVIGETTVTSDLTAQSNFYVSGDAEFSGNVVLLSDSSVLGNFSAMSNFEVQGDAYLKTNLNVSGSAEIAGSLIVMSSVETLGNISTLSDLTVEGNSSIIGDLAVIGETTVTSDLTAQSNFYVSGDSELAGSVVGLGDVNVVGDLSTLSGFEVSGNSYFHSDLNVSGSAEIAGSLVVMTDFSALGNLSILSEGDIFGDVRIHSSLFASGTVTALTGFSGSLTRLSDGTPAFLAGSGITISSSSNGAVMISASVSGNTAKGYISGRSSFIDGETGIVNFGPMGANIGTLSDVSDEVIDVYLNGVFLAYGHDIVEITSETFTLVDLLKNTLQSDDIISIVLRST